MIVGMDDRKWPTDTTIIDKVEPTICCSMCGSHHIEINKMEFDATGVYFKFECWACLRKDLRYVVGY